MNKWSKLYLWYVGLFWALYGMALSFNPDILTLVTGINQDNWVIAAEIRAMYGGLEWGIGLFTLLAVCPRFYKYHHAAILLNAIILSGLTIFRVWGMLVSGPGGIEPFMIDFGTDNIPLSYNAGALWAFEIPCAILGWILLKHLPEKIEEAA